MYVLVLYFVVIVLVVFGIVFVLLSFCVFVWLCWFLCCVYNSLCNVLYTVRCCVILLLYGSLFGLVCFICFVIFYDVACSYCSVSAIVLFVCLVSTSAFWIYISEPRAQSPAEGLKFCVDFEFGVFVLWN